MGNKRKDRISDLPDAIIATDILSRLTTRDAGRTCVLSKRWRYLWIHVPCINFDIQTDVANSCHDRNSQLWLKNCEHVRQYELVTDSLILQKGRMLDSFTISVSPIAKYKALCPALVESLPKWIESALQMRIQSLVIDLYKYNQDLRGDLATPFTSPASVSCIRYLKHLSLNGLGITSEIVEHILSKGRLLEHLSISGSRALTYLKVFGSSSLKFLRISNCELLFRVEISAPNLVTFVYEGYYYSPGSLLVLKHAPSLVNVSYSPMLVRSIAACTKGFISFSSLLHQLETLNLGCSDWSSDHQIQWIRNIELPESTVLTGLKNLSLNIGAYPFEKTLLDLASWIERSPSLRSFTLEIKWRKKPSLEKEMQKLKRCRHQCLKVVKFCGFIGYDNEIELAMYLSENCMVLEEIIIEPSREKLSFWEGYLSRNQKVRKFRALEKNSKSKLQKKLPPRAKLCFL